ncbi:MAG: hypothetical protein ACLFS5_09960, partial [Spirochaetaceae bacterium]
AAGRPLRALRGTASPPCARRDGGGSITGSDGTSGWTYTATVNGEDRSASDASVVFSSGGPYLEIKGNTPQADIDIRITVPEDITPGTYDLETSKPGSHAVLVPEDSSSGTHYPGPFGQPEH